MHSILLVDDEKWVRVALRWTIERSGLPVKVAGECSNGLEALDWLRSNPVDLVLTDIRMPVMDGMNLVREIRQRCLDAQDIIIISVHDEFQLAQNALREGVFDYLLKPVELADMTACLQKWMDKRRRVQTPAEQPQDIKSLSPVKQVLHYIETTPPGEITLADAARKVHMNACYLSQLFKQEMKRNFVDYVTELRIKEAKRLLAQTSLRVSEIADRLGYADIAYFSNIFKKITGETPTDYRNKTGKQQLGGKHETVYGKKLFTN